MDLLQGVVGCNVPAEKLKAEFDAKQSVWLQAIEKIMKAVVEFDMLKLFEKDAPRTFLHIGDNKVYHSITKVLVGLMAAETRPKLVQLIGQYCV